MKHLFFILIISAFNTSYAAIEKNCENLKNSQLKLSIHTQNISYAERAGGNYLKQVVVCKGRDCKTEKISKKRIVYEPGHPHANRRGYVVYPDIDVVEEYKLLGGVVGELKKLARDGACYSKLHADDFMYSIKYKTGSVLKDVFKYNAENKLESWTRLSKNGRVSTVDYISRVEHKTTNLIAF